LIRGKTGGKNYRDWPSKLASRGWSGKRRIGQIQPVRGRYLSGTEKKRANGTEQKGPFNGGGVVGRT